MMTTPIYDKTDRGREEIATRTRHLAPRLRTLLLLVDGRRPEQELLRNVAGLGLTADALTQLLDQGYIMLSASHAALEAELDPLLEAAQRAQAMPAPRPVAPGPRAPSPFAALAPAPAMAVELRQLKFRQLYEFYTKTIRAMIGLRGLPLQLKVEKAATLEELLDLRRPYLEAVLKSKGLPAAQGLAAQIEQLLLAP